MHNTQPPFDVKEMALNVSARTKTHREEVESAAHACFDALRDANEVEEGPDMKDKLRQLTYMYKILAEKYTNLLEHTVRLEAAVELAITSRHQYAMEVIRGDVESASEDALLSSEHR